MSLQKNEISILKKFPKDFTKEQNEIKDIIMILNDINESMDYVNKLFLLNKSLNDNLSKKLNEKCNITKNNILTNNYFNVNLINILSKFLENFSSFLTKNENLFNLKNFDDLILDSKKCYENIISKLQNIFEKTEILSEFRKKYSNLDDNENKFLKEIENNYKELISNENDTKKCFYFNLKDKQITSILFNLNEINNQKNEKEKVFNDCKLSEKNLNLLIKQNFIDCITEIENQIIKFINKFDDIFNEFKNILSENILKNFKQIIENIENLKPIENEQKIKNFDISNEFNKHNFFSSEIPKIYFEYSQNFLKNISLKKITINYFIEFLNNIFEFYNESINSYNKEIKNIFYPDFFINYFKENEKNNLLKIMLNFAKNFFDLHFKNLQSNSKIIFEDLLKFFNSYNEKLIKCEDTNQKLFNDFNKEFLNFKDNIKTNEEEKNIYEKEIEKMTNEINLNPSKVKEFEKKIVSQKKNIDKITNKQNENFQKFLSILTDFQNSCINKFILKNFEEEENSNNEIKKKLTNFLTQIEKILKSENEYLNNKLNIDKKSILEFIKKILIFYSKKFSLDFSLEKIPKTIEDLEEIYFINMEEIIFNNGTKHFLPENKLIEYQNNLNYLNENKLEINYKNLLLKNNFHYFNDLFPLEKNEEIIKEFFNCFMKDSNFQGTVYMTNKNFIFYSFNQTKNVLNVILIIPKNEIFSFEKKETLRSGDLVEICTKNKEKFSFYGISNRDDFLHYLYYTVFNVAIPIEDKKKTKNNKNNENNNVSEERKNENFSIEEKKNESNSFQSNENENNNNENNKIFSNNLNLNEFNKKIEDNEIIKKMKSFTEDKIKLFYSQNKKDFVENFEYEKDFNDVSLPILFNTLFNPNINLNILDGKNFMITYAEKNSDYNLQIIQLDNFNKIDDFYKTNNEEDFNKFNMENNNLTNENNNNNSTQNSDQKNNYIFDSITYTTKFTHPLQKKIILGPSKLEVEKTYNIYIISPLCFIVEITSKYFENMLINNLENTIRYKFTSIPFYDSLNNLHFNSKLNINLSITFEKNWFKLKFHNEIIEECNEITKNILLPLIQETIEKVLESKNEIFKSSNFIKRKKSIKLKNKNKSGFNDLKKIKIPNFLSNINFKLLINKINEKTKNLEKKQIFTILSIIYVILITQICKIDTTFIILLLSIGFALIFKKQIEIENKIDNFIKKYNNNINNNNYNNINNNNYNNNNNNYYYNENKEKEIINLENNNENININKSMSKSSSIENLSSINEKKS